MLTILGLTLLIILSNSIRAEIITDGTLGHQIDLPGPHFQITADLGQQHGGNLFHSFQEFNLQSHESATFSGPNEVQNVISRVTGGNPSTIDGLIRSTIPNAEVYFLNPYGILFGPNAQLDVQGGFHASTADYLRLQDGGRFETRYPNESILTVASVETFGFLTDSPASIQTHTSRLLVPDEKTLSFIGGDLHFTSEIPLVADNTQPIPPVTAASILAASYGRVNLASLAGRGEVILSENDLILEGQGGKITIEDTLVELSGRGGGSAFIRAGQFFLNNTIIRSNTFGDQDGKNISLKVTEAAYLNGGASELSIATVTPKNAGSIFIDAPFLDMTSAFINTGAVFVGAAGSIEINAHQAFLKEGAMIGSGVMGSGRIGNVILNVTDRLSISGYYPGLRLTHAQAMDNTRSMLITYSHPNRN